MPVRGGAAIHEFKITKPVFAYLMFSSSDADTAKSFNYILYISPGDNLNFNADFKKPGNSLAVTGKGSNNNQPLLGALTDAGVQNMYSDTLPRRITAFANQNQRDLKIALEKYIPLYHPTADFMKNENFNVDYDAVNLYFDFKENNKFSIRKAYSRHEAEWKTVQDSLFTNVKLNNDEALTSINYVALLRTFLMREKERLWEESYKHPEAFYMDWYNTDVKTGKQLLEDDMQNLLQEKIVNHYFTGKTAEYMYAMLFGDALGEHNPNNIVTIFDRFKQKYPASEYIGWFGPAIDSIRQNEAKPLTADMVFVADNGTKLNSLEDVLALAKGKTVLLDMWGTWCAPCRNEIHDNGPAIKEYFKDKGLDYFYIANRDLAHTDLWKKLIAYFDMKGTHVMANDSLSRDIMSKVKGSGYPTYVIIKKDGTYELSKAGFPMKRDVLFKQIEEALALKM